MAVNWNPRTGYSNDELAIRTIMGEESSPTGQLAVADVIANRAANPGFGWSNIANPTQFNGFDQTTPVGAPAYNQASSAWSLAQSGTDITGGALYFANPAYSTASWATSPGLTGGLQIGSQYYSDQLGAPSASYPMAGQSLDANAPLGTYTGGASGIASNGSNNFSNYSNSEGTYSGQTDITTQQAAGNYSLGNPSTNWDDALNSAAVNSQNTDYTLGYGAAETNNSPALGAPQGVYGSVDSGILYDQNGAASVAGTTSNPQDYSFAWPSTYTDPNSGGASVGVDALTAGASGSSGDVSTSVTAGTDGTVVPDNSSSAAAPVQPQDWTTYGTKAVESAGNAVAGAVTSGLNGATNAVTTALQSMFGGWGVNVQRWFVDGSFLILGIALIVIALVWVMIDSVESRAAPISMPVPIPPV